MKTFLQELKTETLQNFSTCSSTLEQSKQPRVTSSTFSTLKAALTGALYLPPQRNVNSRFIKTVFAGTKKLLKKPEVVTVGKVWNFKDLTTEKVLRKFLQAIRAGAYIPDVNDVKKLDRVYILDVVSKGIKHAYTRVY